MPTQPSRVRFAEFEMDLDSRELRRARGGGWEPVHLPPQAARLLALLVSRAGTLVDREALRDELWGKRWVDWEAGLHQCVRRVRKTLGDDREPRRFVATVARRGYRFVAPVRPVSGRRMGRRLPAGIAAALFLAVVAGLAGAPARTHRDELGEAAAPAEARRLLREGLHLASRGAGPEALARLERAAERAPRWSEPWSAIAELRLASIDADRVELARWAIEKALVRDPDDPRAWRVLATLRLWEEWDWTGARGALERALELDGDNADVWQLVAALETVERREPPAMAAARRAVELDPVSTARRADLGWTLYYFGHADEAAAECERGLELDPASATAAQCLLQARILTAVRAGNPLPDGLSEHLRRQIDGGAETPACSTSAAAALPLYLTGDPDGAIEALVAGANAGSGWDLPFALADPLLTPLEAEPRLRDLRDSLGLVQAASAPPV